jgi:fructoselysine 6-kinase
MTCRDMLSLVGVGDNCTDVYLEQGLQFPGGNAVNVAAFAARLGARSAYLGCVGTDQAGQALLQALHHEGVDLSHYQTYPGKSAWAGITHCAGERLFLGSCRSASTSLQLQRADLDYLRQFDLIHSSIYSALESRLPCLQQLGRCLSFDFSDQWRQAEQLHLFARVDIAFVSDDQMDEAQARALLTHLQRQGPKVVILMRGRHGAMAQTQDLWLSQAAIPTEVVDTLGAGDGFIAAFLLAWQHQHHLPQALRAAVEYAAQVCRYTGAFGHGRPASRQQLRRIRRALYLAHP